MGGLGVLERSVEILEREGEIETLKEVYAGVNRKSVDDVSFFCFFWRCSLRFFFFFDRFLCVFV